MTQIASIVYRPIGQPNPKDDYLRLDLRDHRRIRSRCELFPRRESGGRD